ncbi:MAG: glycosyltransferase family 4 protein [Candidatus Bathyarchaeota archaeon]|nr:glycosyltransferase family 4 protein [Candidatus Bathyarchaeum sp.]
MESLKIAFLSYTFGRNDYSTGKYGWHLAYELRKMNHDVDIFTTNLHVPKIGPFLLAFKHLFSKLQHYDIVHSNEGAGLFVSHPALLETYHHDYAQVPEFGHRFFNILENMECRKVKHIIVPSYASKDVLLGYGFPPEKISVIYHGVDEIFKEDKLIRKMMRSKLGLTKELVVINVGRFVKHKRQVDLIRALSGFSNVVLILVGNGPEEYRIKDTASKMGVKMLHFKNVSDIFLAGLYNAADVYVHTSTLEGFGLTILEAMSCGLPVIAYTTGDLEQIVGNAGHIVQIGDIESVRAGLFNLEIHSVRNEMRNLALAKSRDFSWSESMKKHSKVYSSVLNQI